VPDCTGKLRGTVQSRSKSWDIKPYTYNGDKEAALIVTMNSNPVNSINPQYIQDMHDTIATLNRDYAHMKYAPVLLTSHSSRTFSAGLDLQYVTGTLGEDKTKIKKFVDDINNMFMSWYMLDRPTIAIINGNCIAGGVITALCCDFRVSSFDNRPEAKTHPLFTLREVFLGLNLPGPLFEIIRSQISNTHTLYQAVLTGRTFNPKEAYEHGLMTELVNIYPENTPENVVDVLYRKAMSIINDRIDIKLSGKAYSVMKKALKESNFKANGYQHEELDRMFIELMASTQVQNCIKSTLNATKKK
jgi:enoyl-CoA hydratase